MMTNQYLNPMRFFQMLLTHPNKRLSPMSKHPIISLVVLLVSLAALPALQAQTRFHDKAAKAAGLNVDSLTAMDAAMQKQIDDKHVAGVIGLITQDLSVKSAFMEKKCLFAAGRSLHRLHRGREERQAIPTAVLGWAARIGPLR